MNARQGNLVIAYLRVSTEHQEREGASLEAQRDSIKKYCRSHGLKLVRVIKEQASGTKGRGGRPGLSTAIEWLGNEGVSGLIVWDLDRFSRNLADAADMIREYFGEGAKYNLITVNEKIDTRSPEGRMYLHMRLVFAEYEAAKIAQRIKAVKSYLRTTGAYAGGGVPYGWKVSKGGKLVPNSKEQKMVSRAVVLREKGLSLREVARILHGEGYTSRGKKEPLHPQQVLRLVSSGG